MIRVAPFNIMTGRDDPMTKSVKPQPLVNPGPGSYKPDMGFDQISRTMQSAKSLSLYGLDKFGITVVKPSTSFASKVNRFTDKHLQEMTRLPGPGQYEAEAAPIGGPQPKKRPSPSKNPEWAQVPWSKIHNPPSIPSHDFVFGYEEENGELVRQKNNESKHTGVKTDTVGPGEYDIPRNVGSRKGP